MNVSEALIGRRTIRKFKQTPIEEDKLKAIINYARLAPFAANVQGLKYKIITDKKMTDRIFNHVKWAGYLPKASPLPDERPPAYIAVLGDTTVKDAFETDAGAAITAMLLGAWEMGIGGCWMGAIRRRDISALLKLPEQYNLLYVVALGYSAQESKECEYRDNPKYFYDDNNVLNVPKLSLDSIII